MPNFNQNALKQMHRNYAITAAIFFLLCCVTTFAQVIERPIPGNTLAGLTPGPDGRYYGVTYEGGTATFGVLYSVDAALGGVVTHVNFDGAGTGAIPYDELVWDPATGKFYGTTTDRGPLGRGTIFSYTPGTGFVAVLRSDFGTDGGGFPRNYPHGLVIANGYIYGLVLGFSTNGDGVFRMAMDGSGFTYLQSLPGMRPQFLVVGPDGKLYGETLYGVNAPCATHASGCGTIFRLKALLPGDTDTQFQFIHEFRYYRVSPCPPGDPYCVPGPPVVYNHPRRLFFGSDGLMYGTTFYSLFRLNPNAGNPSATIQFLWTNGGGISLDAIEGSDGKLYVADYGGGPSSAGQIFSIGKDGSGYSPIRDFSFTTGLEAYGPYGRLFRTASGTIYGTTEYTDVAFPWYGTAFAISPTPLPSPSKVAFTSGRDGNQEIYLMNPDGTNQTRLTTNPAFDYFPSLSRDGSKITFVSDRDGNDEIYVMNVDGTNQTRLTNSGGAANTEPAFSPDGRRIVFASARDGNYEIYVMNVNGTNQTRLTNNAGDFDGHPSFSPDGSRIVFFTDRDFNNNEIYVMNADGTNQTRLTNNTESDDRPAFSPDGTKIVFRRHGSTNSEIYLMNANGTNAINLTNNPAFDEYPSFSPDGAKIAFMSARDGNSEIYSMNADGTSQSRLTNNATSDAEPSWGGAFTPPSPPIAVKLKVASGNVLVGSPGEGLILRSPNGTVCLKIGIDNAGAMTTTMIACP